MEFIDQRLNRGLLLGRARQLQKHVLDRHTIRYAASIIRRVRLRTGISPKGNQLAFVNRLDNEDRRLRVES
jgi:hypothetical protein